MYVLRYSPRFDVQAFLADHPEPDRQKVSAALYVAEGKIPMDARLHARIRQVVDMTSKAGLAVSHTQLAAMAHCSEEEITQFYEGRSFAPGDPHPHTERAYQIAWSEWSMALARAVADAEMPGLCTDTADYAQFRSCVDEFHSCAERDNYRHNHAESWAAQGAEIAESLRYFWHLGNQAPRVRSADDLEDDPVCTPV